MPEVTLIGTIHNDPASYARTRAALENANSDCICVESLRPTLDRRRKQLARGVRKKIADILATYGLDFAMEDLKYLVAAEDNAVLAAESFAIQRGLPLIYIEPDETFDVIKQKLQQVPRFVQACLETKSFDLLYHPGQHEVDFAYANLRRGNFEPDYESIILRDFTMAQEILRATEHGNVVHIGGAGHILPDKLGYTLGALLAYMNPTYHLLIDFSTEETEETEPDYNKIPF